MTLEKVTSSLSTDGTGTDLSATDAGGLWFPLFFILVLAAMACIALVLVTCMATRVAARGRIAIRRARPRKLEELRKMKVRVADPDEDGVVLWQRHRGLPLVLRPTPSFMEALKDDIESTRRKPRDLHWL